MSELANAQARSAQAWKEVTAAENHAHKSEAELARLTLLRIAAKNSGVMGFSYEVEYVYDDEGSYYPTVDWTVDVSHLADDAAAVEDDVRDELQDLGFHHASLDVLFGGENTTLSPDELRAKAF